MFHLLDFEECCHLSAATVTDLRHELHKHPELSMKEVHTRELLMAFLSQHTSARICDEGSWFWCVFGENEPGEPIAFRADIDALPIEEDDSLPYHSVNPGVSHKCGHDGHAACLCGLALMLERYPVKRPVYLIFQPGEEIGAGGRMCAGLVKERGIPEVYAFHNLGGYPENSIVYRSGLTQPASEGLRISFRGKCAHASAPENGKNPAAALARMILFLQELSERPSRGLVLATVVGLKAGAGDFGISAGDGELSLTLRAEYEQEMKELEARILAYADEQASLEGLEVSHEISDRFPETKNTEHALSRVREAAECLGKELIEMKDLWRASEDFGYYTKIAEGAIFYIGTGEDVPPLHTQQYDFNDRIIETAMMMFYTLASQ